MGCDIYLTVSGCSITKHLAFHTAFMTIQCLFYVHKIRVKKREKRQYKPCIFPPQSEIDRCKISVTNSERLFWFGNNFPFETIVYHLEHEFLKT